jgi:hypothetical protein
MPRSIRLRIDMAVGLAATPALHHLERRDITTVSAASPS